MFVSVHLARRVLALERENTSLNKDIELAKSMSKQMETEVRGSAANEQSIGRRYNYTLQSCNRLMVYKSR